MMKEEFEAIIRETVSAQDYAIIERVYASHPSISETDGKVQIAAIYKLPGGMRIIRDMVPTADTARDIEDRIIALESSLRGLRQQLRDLAK